MQCKKCATELYPSLNTLNKIHIHTCSLNLIHKHNNIKFYLEAFSTNFILILINEHVPQPNSFITKWFHFYTKPRSLGLKSVNHKYTFWLLYFPNHGEKRKFEQLPLHSSQPEQFFKTTLISLARIKTLTKIHCFNFLVTTWLTMHKRGILA